MKRIATLSAIIALLSIPTAAAAYGVPAAGSTRAKIIQAVGFPAREAVCFSVRLDGTNRSWAIQTTPSDDAYKRACHYVQPGGFAILHYAAARWRVVTEADHVGCPMLSRPGEPSIPAGVLRALTGKSCNQLPRVITGYAQPQFKPYRMTVTGDGSGFFGGTDGPRIVRRSPLSNIGRLRWTKYTATEAWASGGDWGLYGSGCNACDRHFQRDGSVRLHFWRPNQGVFTRLTYHTSSETILIPGRRSMHLRAQTQTIKAVYNDGWYW